METITLNLTSDWAEKLYAAVGRHLCAGDVAAVEGQSQFSTALAAVCASAQPAQPATPINTKPAAPATFTPKK